MAMLMSMCSPAALPHSASLCSASVPAACSDVTSANRDTLHGRLNMHRCNLMRRRTR